MNTITITLELSTETLKTILPLLAPNEIPAVEIPTVKVTSKKEEPESVQEPVPVSMPEPVLTQSAVTKADIRKAALALSKAGKQDALVKVYEKYGAEKLSDFTDETKYPEILKDLEDANA